MNTKILIAVVLLVSTAGEVVSAATVAGPAAIATPARGPAAAPVVRVPIATKPQAPLMGTIGAIDVEGKTISIAGARHTIGEPYLVLMDKRPGANGLIELTDVTAGMRVRYRTVAEAGGTRVVELWILASGTESQKAAR